jgi:hypothetical protein
MGLSYQLATDTWQRNWERISAMYQFSPEIRRRIYTTNPIESFNRQLRKVTKNRGVFPNDDAVFLLLYKATQDITKKWTMKESPLEPNPGSTGDSLWRPSYQVSRFLAFPYSQRREAPLLTKEELSDRLLDKAARCGRAASVLGVAKDGTPAVADTLDQTRLARHISSQFVRSAASPAANYEEACAAESVRDFVHKLSVVLKELRESRIWRKPNNKGQSA